MNNMQIFLFIFFHFFVSRSVSENYQKSGSSSSGSVPTKIHPFLKSPTWNRPQTSLYHRANSLELDPTFDPSCQPTLLPSSQPSEQPTRLPTAQPTRPPSSQPISEPSAQPTSQPTDQPSCQPTTRPTFRSRHFSYTGAMETYIVPSSIHYIEVDIAGAAGGSNGGGFPGFGARVQTSIPVTPGSTLYIFFLTRWPIKCRF
jgi:hypothetical protein